jgi:hypothetical protein
MCVFALVGAVQAAAPAQFLWRENLQGDLSDDRFMPTALTLSPGGNLLLGAINGMDSEGTIDRDYFSVTIPAGFVLARLDHVQYESQDFAAFIGIDPGPIFSISPDEATPDILFGWALFGDKTVEMDLLPMIGKHGMGFTPPLPEGVYTFWVQQTGESTVWAANFFVEEVPGPWAGWAVVIGVGGRRRSRLRSGDGSAPRV